MEGHQSLEDLDAQRRRKLNDLLELSINNFFAIVSQNCIIQPEILNGCFECKKKIHQFIENALQKYPQLELDIVDAYIRVVEKEAKVLVDQLGQEMIPASRAIASTAHHSPRTGGCSFCGSRSHVIHHNGETVCPVLLENVCTLCKNKGHTRKFCF